MRQWSLINATVGPVFPKTVSRFCSNRKKQPIAQIRRPHYPIWAN